MVDPSSHRFHQAWVASALRHFASCCNNSRLWSSYTSSSRRRGHLAEIVAKTVANQHRLPFLSPGRDLILIFPRPQFLPNCKAYKAARLVITLLNIRRHLARAIMKEAAHVIFYDVFRYILRSSFKRRTKLRFIRQCARYSAFFIAIEASRLSLSFVFEVHWRQSISQYFTLRPSLASILK